MNNSGVKKTSAVIKYVQRKDFFKLYSRNASVQITENFAYHSMLLLQRSLHISFSQLIVSHKEFCDAYVSKEELIHIEMIVERRIMAARSIKDFYEDMALPIFNRYIDLTHRLNIQYTNDSNHDGDLLRDYTDFVKMNAIFLGPLWYIFLADSVFDTILKKFLHAYLKEIGKENELQRYLTLLSTPLKKSAVVREHEELLSVALKHGSKEYGRLLTQHTQKWRWFPCYNPSDDPYTIEHYHNELKRYTASSARKELVNMRLDRRKHEKDYKRFLNSIHDPMLKKLVSLVNMTCFYRDHRNDLRREGLCSVRPLYEAIGRRFGLTVKETCYLTNEEIHKSLKTGKLHIPKHV